ncbi:hypothetical protein [Methylocystis iwaonis]|uniref:hypothetical protein n=1 Tax=Methylocystis iwaonis TaxID=2885079 RepID=UPI002E7B68F8|nr:hypothetical protein [Methylocystis iwaonis]
MPLPYLFSAQKSISYRPNWTAPDKEDGHTRIVAALDVGEITEASLALLCSAYAHLPDRHVSVEICINGLDGKRRIRLARVDWKSIKGGHSNKRGHCKGDWDGKRVPETHYHSFEMNYVTAERRMKAGKLPCARPIDEPLQSFEELCAFIGFNFNIKNMDVVAPPPWEYKLPL